MGILTEFLQWLPGYFFPKMCYGCEKEGSYVCDQCRPEVEKVFNSPICPNCQQPSRYGLTHQRCRLKSGLDGLISYYQYAGWTKEIVKDAKFGQHHYWRAMAELAAEFAGELSICHLSFVISHSSVIVPLPLHWWRELKRGFNQAEIIAKPLSKLLSLPMEAGLVVRTKYSQPQTLIDKQIPLKSGHPDHRRLKILRRQNVLGTFKIKDGAVIPETVILVDDVWTTGATMKECCKVLKRAGVKKVWGITLLRA